MKKIKILLSAFLMAACLACSSNSESNNSQHSSSKPTGLVPSYAEEMKPLLKQHEETPLPEDVMKTMAEAAEQLKITLPNPGLKVGAQAPDFKLLNAYGENVALKELLKQGPVILVFYRGSWCPYCNIYLNTLQKAQPHFKAAGAQLVAVTPQKPEWSKEQIEKSGLDFQVLSDFNYQVIKEYNLYFELSPELRKLYEDFGIDLVKHNGTERAGLPIAATFVIDQTGKVLLSYAPHDYKQRLEPAKILELLN